MSGLRSVTFRCRGHPAIRGTHRKSVEFTQDPEVTRRATCVLGVAADVEPSALRGFRGPVAVTVAAGGHAAVIRAVANPGFEPGTSLVVRTSRHPGPDTLAVAADTGAGGLDRGLVAELADPRAVVTVTVSELPAPSRPEHGALTVLSMSMSMSMSGVAARDTDALRVLRSADAVLATDAATARKALAAAGERLPVHSLGDVDPPELWREGQHLVCLAVTDQLDVPRAALDVAAAAVETGAALRIAPAPSLATAAAVLTDGAPHVLLETPGQEGGARTTGFRAAASGGVPLARRESPETVDSALRDVEALPGTRQVRLWISPASTQGWVLRGTAAEVRAQWDRTGRPPGELILVVAVRTGAAGEATDPAGDEANALLARLLDEGIPARTLAQALACGPEGDYRREYRRVLRIKSELAARRELR